MVVAVVGKGIRQKVVSTVAVVTIVLLLLLLGAKIGKLSPSANKWGGARVCTRDGLRPKTTGTTQSC